MCLRHYGKTLLQSLVMRKIWISLINRTHGAPTVTMDISLVIFPPIVSPSNKHIKNFIHYIVDV